MYIIVVLIEILQSSPWPVKDLSIKRLLAKQVHHLDGLPSGLVSNTRSHNRDPVSCLKKVKNIFIYQIKVIHNGWNDLYKRQFFWLWERAPNPGNWIICEIFFLSNWLVLQAAYYNLTETFFAQIISVTSNAKFPILKSR